MADLTPEELYLVGMAHFEGSELVEQSSQTALLREALEEEVRLRQIESQKHDARVAQLEQEIEEFVKLERLSAPVNVDHCVVFLINGNDLIFSPVLFNRSETGGIAAADRLSLAIDKHLTSTQPSLDSSLKVIVRIYANVSNLAQNLEDKALIDSVVPLENFIRGFNSRKLCFDFIDVGNGDTDADAKIKASLSLYIGNPQCVQIVLGIDPWHKLFTKLEKTNCYQFPSIYLLNSTLSQNERVLLGSNVQTVRFDNVFYKNISEQPHQTLDTKPSVDIWDIPIIISKDNDIGLQSSPAPSSPTNTIPRNILGQRIDPTYPTTPSSWRRIQQLRLCNDHFLRHDCKSGEKCKYKHKVSPKDGGLPDGSLSKHDLQILAEVSRSSPCRNGTACDDAKCMYGHRCPAQESGRKAGEENGCKWGKDCRFSPNMHVADTEVFNMNRVRGQKGVVRAGRIF